MLLIACHTHDRGARGRLFREKDCDLRKAIEALRVSEVTRYQLKDIGDEDLPHTVNAVRQQGDKRDAQTGEKRKQLTGIHKRCTRCGKTHPPDHTKCPALGKQCNSCGKLNHFQSVCRTKNRLSFNTPVSKVSQVIDSSDSEDCVFAIEHVGAICHTHKDQYFVPLTFTHNGRSTIVRCQLDTGATCNVMSYSDLCAVHQSSTPSMQSTTTRLRFYNNDTVCAMGECTLCCRYKKFNYDIHFKIIPGTQNPLLSGTTCQALGLITVNTVNSVQDFEDPLIMQYDMMCFKVWVVYQAIIILM